MVIRRLSTRPAWPVGVIVRLYTPTAAVVGGQVREGPVTDGLALAQGEHLGQGQLGVSGDPVMDRMVSGDPLIRVIVRTWPGWRSRNTCSAPAPYEIPTKLAVA
jgi:hypothetical protein